MTKMQRLTRQAIQNRNMKKMMHQDNKMTVPSHLEINKICFFYANYISGSMKQIILIFKVIYL